MSDSKTIHLDLAGCPICGEAKLHEHIVSEALPPGDHPTYEQVCTERDAARAEVERNEARYEVMRRRFLDEQQELCAEVEQLRDSLFTADELRRIAARAEKRPRNGQDIQIAAKARKRLSLLVPARAALGEG